MIYRAFPSREKTNILLAGGKKKKTLYRNEDIYGSETKS
jgi:hypothetical protein